MWKVLTEELNKVGFEGGKILKDEVLVLMPKIPLLCLNQ